MASLAPSWAENLKGADQVQPFSHAARPSLLPYANARQHITSEPVRLRQPSILDLLTALPLLLALDDRDYIDTLNGALERRAASAQQQQQRRKAAVHHASPSACLSDDEDPCDAATTAVVAVLRGGGGGGSAAWQTQRRRLRRAALDAFFQATLPTPLSTRGADGAASSGGIHGATLRLLAHTRAVLSDVSPTQAHLMDLFASRLLGSKLDTKSARAVNSSVGGDEEDIASYAEEGERKNSTVFLAGGENAASASLSSAAAPPMPRSIMKPSAPHVAPSAERKSAPTASPSSVSIAEQLLYIVLRTSIAANTPRRAEIQDNARRTATVAAAERSSSLYTPPGLSSDAHRPSSPTTTASSSGSAVHKKPRADLQQTTSANTEDDADGPSALFSDREGDSIRHRPTRGGLVLPYEPQCWLGPTTVSLVENSAVLHRQQRWTCDGDPVVEATIAGDGQDTYDSAVAAAAAVADEGGFTSGVQQRRLTGRRRHWTAASERDGAALRTLVRGSALPFFTATRGADPSSANEAAPAFHWDYSATNEEKAVDVLFTARVSSETEASAQSPHPHALPTASAAAAAEDAKSVSDREAPSSPSLPLCRTPFVSCNAVYDPVLYARVFVALHRCTAGLIDPFELTFYDCRGGPNAVEIRVRPEFYTTAAQVRSGLTAMLEQGCRCGTLLLRLHRLCAVAEEATLRASLGSYGRSAMDTLRLVLCLLQRQMWELGDREGGTHRLSFTELLTAQQRLQTAAEQVEALAVFFAVPAASVPAAPTRSARTPTTAQAKISPQLWDPVAVLQGSCCSALLLSRLHQFFTTRHANALGRHGSAFAAGYSASNGADEEEEELRRAAFLEGMGEGRDTATRHRQSPCENDDAAARLRRRKELLSRAIDGIGLLLRATLRPLNTMLHRWLTAGELADPYDEFFVVPSHGSTHSGFTLDLSPQRLPVFVSAAAASDLLHAGVSLRVLRGAATHVVHSAQKDTRRLLALAELTDAAADEYAEELQDTQTLRTAIEAFIERLVRGAPTVSAVHAMGSCHKRQTELLPLPPRVDVLAACGAPQWWRQHYHACTQLLLEAVEQPVFAAATEGEEQEEKRSTAHDATEAPPQTAVADDNEEEPPSEEPQGSSKTASTTTTAAAAAAARASEPQNEEAQQTVVAAAEAFHPSESPSATHTAATTAAAAATTHLTYPLGIAPPPADGAQTQRGEHHGETQRRDHRTEGDEEEEQHYITVFMNSDEDDEVADNIVSADKIRPTASSQQRQQHGEETTSARSSRSSSSSPSAAAASSTATSVLGLRRIAGSAFSTSSTLSSTASSRGTIALYGAITEELRQVSMMEQQTEARAGQSRHALRAEFTAQMLRRRREMRLVDWKAQRLALRLRRVRAMSEVVDELREVYGIRGVGYVMANAPTVDSEGHEHDVQGAATRFVVPLTQLPPPRAQPPVVLYADVRGGEAEREGRQPRRTSFAATVSTVVQPALRRPSSPTAGSLLMPPRHRRTQSLGGQSQQSGPRDEENPLYTCTRMTQQSTKMAIREQRSASFSTSVSSGVATQRVHVDVCVPRLAPPSPTALSLSASASGGSPRSVRHLSDVAAGSWNGPGAAGSEGGRSGATTLQRNEREMAVEAAHTAFVGQALVDEEAGAAAAAAVAADAEAEASGLQYDELGYAHHAAHYVVADINDDEFLFARTGPKSYARREAEVAALTQLAEGRARLDACTVDTPAFLRQLADAAHSLLLRESTECGENAAATAVTAEEEEEEGERTATAASRCASGLQPAALSTAWRMDDPLDHPHRHAFADTPTSTDAEGEEKMDCTGRLWSWTPAEAHRWYFDNHLPFHHALTSDTAVDRALLLNVPLRASEAEALQSCGVYYRALGQYTAGFLTHKALQLTLLPPYGSLHRLTTQFLDVCLLQKASSAVRIVDVWIAAVDTALEMMTEQEEAAMVSAAVAGITDVPLALASLTDAQHGLDLAAALTALNGVFQSEWAACVAGGDATVTLAWTLGTASDTSLSTHQHQPRQRQRSRENRSEEEEGKDNLALLNDSDDADSSSDIEPDTRDEQQQPTNAVESKKDDATSQRARVGKRRAASPIQSFLAALRLTAVSPWCSGAWLLPERTTRSLGGIFAALLFWKSVERVVLHTWRAGMASGLSSVFFFCTTVRQVLLSTLHEPLWGRLTELAAAYRGSLLFEAGVLYSYRSLESFTADHERFLEECEFYSLCAPTFLRQVRPLLWAMMREVEVAEQAVRFAQVATRVARRQYMTTFHSMVSGGSSSSSSSDEDDHGEEVLRKGSSRGARATFRSGASSVYQGKPTTVVPPSTAAAQPSAAAAAAGASATHVFTPSRWSRRRLRDAGSGGALRSESAASSSPPSLRRPHTPWYMRPIEAALAEQQQPQQRTAPSTTTSIAANQQSDTRSASALSSTTAATTANATTTSASRARTVDGDEEGSGEEDEVASACSRDSAEEEEGRSASQVRHAGDSADPAEAVKKKKRKKKRRRPQQTSTTAKGPPRRSIMESARMNTTPIYATLLANQSQQQRHRDHLAAPQLPPPAPTHKRSRSGGVGHRSAAAPSAAAAVADGPLHLPSSSSPPQRRPRRGRGDAQGPRFTPEERQERRAKLRVIAERKIQEATEHQRRRVRDVVARRLRRFASLTVALRDALSDVIAEEDVSAQGAMGTNGALRGGGGAASTAAAAKELHDAQRQQMNRFAYLSAMVRRLDSLIAVMASQV